MTTTTVPPITPAHLAVLQDIRRLAHDPDALAEYLATITDPDLILALTPRLRLTTYIRITHTPAFSGPQETFLLLDQQLETMYGGSAGGGKSHTLLAAALQWADHKEYSALLLRKTYGELALPGGLMDMAFEWLTNTDAKWHDATKTWHFPSGATLTFGFLEGAADKYRYQGASFHFIGIDEITHHPFDTYSYMLSRLRKTQGSPIPIRMRVTGNPPDDDETAQQYDWPREYFVEQGPAHGRGFVPAKLEDNFAIDQVEYDRALQRLGPIRYAQLRHGDWRVRRKGGLFYPDRLKTLPSQPVAGVLARYIGVDKAGTDASAKGARHAKYTVLLRMSRVNKAIYGVSYVIEDIIRGQWSAATRNRVIREAVGRYRADEPAHLRIVAQPAPLGTEIFFEREPGSGGQESSEISVTEVAPVPAHVYLPTGQKIDRARPFASAMENYEVGIVAGCPHAATLAANLQALPFGQYWDEADAAGMIYNALALLDLPGLPLSAPGQMRQLAPGMRW